MAQATLRNIAIGLVATGLLAGCVDGTGASPEGGPGIFAPAKKSGGSRDIEAPELFQSTEAALWDGRPSLGGLWVASPDAKDPERVVIVNTENGKSVTGALFRRERDNPGPRLQLSSDAAEALGVLAGQPVTLKVTALRREEEAQATAPVAPPAKADAVKPAVEPAPPPPAEAKPADAKATAATAAAALDAVEGAGDAAETEAPEKPKTWKERRAEAKAAREAKKAAAAAAKAEAEAAKAEAATEAGVSADAVEITDIQTAPLDTRSTEAPAKAAPEAKAADVKVAAEPAVAKPAAPAGAGDRTIQIASFSKEENATRAVEALAKIGVTARVKKSGTEGKMVWSLLATGDAAMLNSIKSAGFADAYFLN